MSIKKKSENFKIINYYDLIDPFPYSLHYMTNSEIYVSLNHK